VPPNHLPEEKAAIRELVRSLYSASGATTWASFARRAGVSELSLCDWRQGRGMPSSINLLRLLSSVADREGAVASVDIAAQKLRQLV
jgi:hypothetical protein